MEQYIEVVSQTLTAKSARLAARKERKNLLKAFWLGTIILFLRLGFTIQTPDFLPILGAILIAFFSLLPSYLWCTGRALGLPIFPIFALTYLWTYAFQLVNNNPLVTVYSPDNLFFASISVVICLATGTFVWFLFVNSPSKPPKFYRAFSGKKGELFFFISLIINIFFNMARLGNWLSFGIFYSLIVGVTLGINTLSICVLAYSWGAKELSKTKASFFVILLIILIITNSVNLALVGSIAMFILAVLAFMASRRQVPWKTITIGFLIFAFLHYGKGEMRSEYWWGSKSHFIQPTEYPAFYAEWIDFSWKNFNKMLVKSQEDQVYKGQSLTERTSLIHLLLMVQKKTPAVLPYLGGATYTIIPQLLIPRFLNQNKLSSLESTSMLSIYYGLQTRGEIAKTTVAWGLVNEAYANFGLYGCAGLAVVLGILYGQASRWCMHTPLLSSRSLFSVILFSLSFQTETTASVYITTLFQSIVILVGMNFTMMAVHKMEEPPVYIHHFSQSK